MAEASTSSSDIRRVSIGPLQLAVKVTGTGPTVILEMGGAFGGISPIWGGVDDELAKFCRVVVYDRAGLGNSDQIRRLPSMTERAQNLAALLDALDIREPALFAGWSLGGMIVENFAARYPEHVGGLLLIDPTPPDLLHQAGRFGQWGFSVGMRIMNRVQLLLAQAGFFRTRYGHNLMRKFASAQFGPHMPPQYAELVIDATTRPPMHRAMILETSKVLEECQETDRLLTERGLPRVPSMLLAATHRPGFLETNGSVFHKRILELAPGMVLREISETGHLIAGEAPQSIVQAVRDLLAQMAVPKRA